MAVEAGDDVPHIGGGTAPGEGQVRREVAVVGRRGAGPACGGGDGRREVGERAQVAGQAAPQHMGPRRLGECARARQAEAERVVPSRAALKPEDKPWQAFLAYLAKEGERNVPQFTAGPPQVVADRAERRAGRVQVVKNRRRRREPHK